MQQLWELHRDLSLAIGDSVNLESYTRSTLPTTIPDGVRFSKALRDSYLYRAMLMVMNNHISKSSQLTHAQASQYLERIFPGMLYDDSIFFAEITWGNRKYTALDTARDPLFLIRAWIINNNSEWITVPVVSSNRATALMSTRNAQLMDMCIYPLTGGIALFNAYDDIVNQEQLAIRYIPYPDNPALLPNVDDEVYFDDLHYKTMLNLATIYAHIDSQDIQDLTQIAAMEASLISPGGQ